jgi:hypothetical protein
MLPVEHHTHDIGNVHFLEDAQQFLACPILASIIKSFRQDFLLLNWISLVNAIGKELMLCLCEFIWGQGGAAYFLQVIENEANLIFVGDRRTNSLEPMFFTCT